jgi:type I restriction enzyme S subunit
MNADRLLAHYERVADAPNALPRLRRFILDLAVRGKLVPQDLKDEPASALLGRLGKGLASTVRTSKRGVQGEGVEPSYRLPRTWSWVRIGDHLALINGMAFKPTDWLAEGIKIVRIQNLNRLDAPFNYCSPKRVRDRFLINDGAFLISWSGTPGTSFGAFVWDRGPAVLNQHIFRCDFRVNAFEPQYLRLAINGRLDEMIARAHGGVGLQHITKGKLEALLIALPPIAEQRRIVEKIDELMVLCDQLEAARTEREAARERLATASLVRLSTPDPDPATFRDHARFVLDNLAVVTARPDQIKQLRQTILSLAMCGKLVPHDAADGPIDQLLSDLETKQRQLVDKGVIKRAAPSAMIQNEEQLVQIPQYWRWMPLGKLISFGPQNGISPKSTNSVDAPRAITLTATTSGYFDGSKFKHVEANIPSGSEFWLSKGDLLFQRGNTREYVGMAAYYTGDDGLFVYPDLMIKVRLLEGLCLQYIHLAVISPIVRGYFSANASGASETMPKINQDVLLSTPIPLAPLAEQHRIVDKVDELMALCDRLEASLVAGDETRRRLLNALLAEALAPDGDNVKEASRKVFAHA